LVALTSVLLTILLALTSPTSTAMETEAVAPELLLFVRPTVTPTAQSVKAKKARALPLPDWETDFLRTMI
jgi:hypothetical protein